MAPQLLALLDLQRNSPTPKLAEFLQLTLDKIAGEGLRDHVDGGFYRYTVDPSWEIPHFEKMLYTQAMLADVFMLAADVFSRQDYAEVARDTLKFVDKRDARKKRWLRCQFFRSRWGRRRRRRLSMVSRRVVCPAR